MSPDFASLLAAAQDRPFAFIVGWPVEHSRSPLIHGYWMQERHRRLLWPAGRGAGR